ncbi:MULTISPECIES: PIN domain-containing protein [unclassified Agromyces]|uniref:PIN domain-containing protein n=1 Tax=unclassified Agromyces TaxID=2639701 RepID=UPI003015141C
MSRLEVLVDTNVATWLWMSTGTQRRGRAQTQLARYGDQLTGKTLVISGQTRAELLQLKNGRGEHHHGALLAAIDRIAYLPLNKAVQERYAELSHWGRTNGHEIAQKQNAADRWIAATAVQFALPLASEDRVFDGLPQLELIAPVG